MVPVANLTSSVPGTITRLNYYDRLEGSGPHPKSDQAPVLVQPLPFPALRLELGQLCCSPGKGHWGSVPMRRQCIPPFLHQLPARSVPPPYHGLAALRNERYAVMQMGPRAAWHEGAWGKPG